MDETIPLGKGSWRAGFGLENVDKVLTEVHNFIEYPMLAQVFMETVCWVLLKFTIALGLSGRGDGNGGRFVHSPCLPSWRGLRSPPLRCTSDAVLFAFVSLTVPVQRQSIEFPATTVGECWRRHSL